MTQIIYVSSPDNQQIYVWKLNRQYNILKLIQIVYTPGKVQPMSIHPNKQFLYVGIRPNFGILTYSINQSGLLKDEGFIKICSSPTHLISNIKGTFLYCASYNFNTVTVIPLNNSAIPDYPVQIIQGLSGCHSTNIDKNNEELIWVPCLKEHTIRLFKINSKSNGILVPWNPSYIKMHADSGPRHMTFDGSGCYAYIINELNATVNVIKYDFFKNILSIVQTLSIFPKNMNIKQYWASDIHITPDGHWLYCSDRATNLISCFEISNQNNQLKFSNYQLTELQPRGFAIDPKGEFLIVAGQISNYIAMYRINSNNGKLMLSSRHQSGCGPMWISIKK